ncbi:hypothetical protein HHI36_004897 [Cryptolaemus montrouzieri]|uniref:Uncharacterized protein n=1 Tax=Cryptolaemus montrouzieri TaxID=559131 RepID=A0ABD2NSJ5_9CUCU
MNGITPNSSIVSLGFTILSLCLPNASIKQKVQVDHDEEIQLGDYDGLLGIYFMRNYHAVIDYENNNIKINHIVVPFKSKLFKSAINYADKIIVPPHSDTVVQVNITNDIPYDTPSFELTEVLPEEILNYANQTSPSEQRELIIGNLRTDHLKIE